MKRTTQLILKSTTLGALLLGASAFQAHAGINVVLPGTSQYEGWEGLTAANYNQALYGGGFPGGAPWTAPIDSNILNSDGNANFNKLLGNGYPSGASIYAPFTSSEFGVFSTSVVSGLETVVFQIDIGPGDGGNFFDAVPTLSLTHDGGSTLSIAATYTLVGAGAFPFSNPLNPLESGTTSLWMYQWDLSSYTGITSYDVTWQTHKHSQIYTLQLDSGNTFSGMAIPEPASTATMAGLLVLVATALIRRRRKS